jgi:hypothetical protein
MKEIITKPIETIEKIDIERVNEVKKKRKNGKQSKAN